MVTAKLMVSEEKVDDNTTILKGYGHWHDNCISFVVCIARLLSSLGTG